MSANHCVQLLQERFNSEKQLDNCLADISASLQEDQYDTFLKLLINLPTSPPTLELVLASTELGPDLTAWIVKTYPSDPKKVAASIHRLLLMRLSTTLPFVYPFDRTTMLELRSLRSDVEYTPRVLEHLLWFTERKGDCTPDIGIEADDLPITIQRTQRQRKGMKGTAKPASDPTLAKAFAALELEYPPTDVEGAKDEIHFLHEDQLDTLKHYISALLQLSQVELHIRKCFIHEELSEEENKPEVTEEQVSVETDVIAEAPVAYPMVQPMKAALYFDSAEGFGEWRILISTRADRDLRDARRKDAKFFKIVVKKIKELSKGHFSADNQKRLNGPNTEIPIYEAKMTRDSPLIYQIDCVPESHEKVERQIIKIFGVYTHAQINKNFWDSVGYQLFLKKGKEYKQRCIFRSHPKTAGDNIFAPACFPAVEHRHVSEGGDHLPHLPHESLEEMHTLLVLEKFVPFSQALLNSIIAELDVAHVFDVSTQEREIVEYPYSCYVLGRSGTGKTTTMLFKMLGIERAYTLRKDSMNKPRQIFVTQSRVLAGKVEEYFSKLLGSLATADKTKEELARMIKSKKQDDDNQEGLIDVDDDQNWRGDLPTRFSQLKDEHFPLFLTFDRLASMLEADMSHILATEGLSSSHIPSSANTISKEFQKAKIITYHRFLEHYWPHFPQNLRKGLDPALVFSELMGVIQGSEESLSQEHNFLDKRTYENLSHRAQYAFSSRRDTIYAIFVSYLKQKKASDEYDAADRTHHILKAFQTTGVPGQKIDYLYVDEAQDNLLIDALLLRSLVGNPDGLFWAGDTAQTISVGSSFRFDDLKAFLFRLEKRREDAAAAHAADAVFKQEAPRTFQLAVNYRSHGGIVQCAHSVIELITEFWPYAIDALARERGVIDGSKPVFFSGWDGETVRYEQFLFGESGDRIEFGAQQCILVRDERARDELRKQVGDIGLIMTLYESKGLEFDDVLLYKFFEDSTVELSQWRVVLNLLQHADTCAPLFDQVRHAGVCSELKFLYVAITRARKNLWIVDCSEKCEPMRKFWTERNEIQNCTPGTDVPRLAVSSSPEEWEKSGRTLFSNKRYLQAMHCFERAGLDREANVSQTYYLREQARLTPMSNLKQGIGARKEAFAIAAKAFIKCAEPARNSKERKAYFRSAGDCFEHAGQEYDAAEAYSKAEEYNLAIKLYRKCAKFDEAVSIVVERHQEVDQGIAENIIDVARLFYFKGGELEKANKLFDSIEEELEYLEDFDLDVSRAAVLEKLGKFKDAAAIHLAEGRTMDAIRVYLLDENDEDSVRSGYDSILRGLWEKASFGVKSLGRIEQVVQLLDLASTLQISNKAWSFNVDELLMFQAIRNSSQKDLRVLGRRFMSAGLRTPALLCWDHYFSSTHNTYSMNHADMTEFLGDFLGYCRLLQSLVSLPNPSSNPQIQKLFSFTLLQDGNFLLPTATYLNNKTLESRSTFFTSNDQGLVVSEWDLNRVIKESLTKRIREQITKENEQCKVAQAFNICFLFAANQHCNRQQCPNLHINAADLTLDWYNLQVKSHLQQILIIHIWCHFTFSASERMKYIREWLGRLFDVLYPMWYRLGSINNLANATSEASDASIVLKRWSFELLFAEYRQNDPRLVTMAYQIMKICLRLDKPQTLVNIKRSRLMDLFRHSSKFQRKNGEGWVCILDDLFHALSTVNIDSVSRGIVAVKTILDNSITIDANVLFQTIEFLCASIILVKRSFAPHNVTLPHSLLANLFRALDLSDCKFDPCIDQMIRIFIGSLRYLMEQLSKNPQQLAYLQVDKSDLFLRRSTRNIYTARLCRALCLLGYNINNIGLRSEILDIITHSLNSGTDKSHPYLYREYAYAKHWSDLARLVKKSIMDCPLDEMIELVHQSKYNKSSPTIPHIRRVVYTSVVEIPSLLNRNANAPSISNLRPDAPVFVPKPSIPEASEAELDQITEEPEADNAQIINSTVAEDIITVEAPQEETLPPSEAQVNAAIIIQSTYRKWVVHKQKGKSSTLSLVRNGFFEECLLESRKMEWSIGSYYRRLFLGPIPHILVCLKTADVWAFEMKRRNKKRYSLVSHQDLEDIKKRLTEQKKLIDRIKRLQKALSPDSDLHRRRDIEELKRYVLEVESLIHEIGPAVSKDMADDLAIGLKGIVATRKLPQTKPKPTLRTDDEDDMYLADEYVAEDYGDDGSLPSSDSVHNGASPEQLAQVSSEYVGKQDVEEDLPFTVIQSLPWVRI